MSSTPSPAATDAALRSVHTSNLPALFGQLQVSLVVSTYQAGKVILIRNDEDVLNTHFRTFGKPMGIAGDRARLTIGGTNTVWYYRNLPAVAEKLEPPGKYDACYLPRRVHVTGDIDIHELAWDAKDELWVVNTRFGCLCTLDGDHSFYPRWRPPFLSALAPEDRCHLIFTSKATISHLTQRPREGSAIRLRKLMSDGETLKETQLSRSLLHPTTLSAPHRY